MIKAFWNKRNPKHQDVRHKDIEKLREILHEIN